MPFLTDHYSTKPFPPPEVDPILFLHFVNLKYSAKARSIVIDGDNFALFLHADRQLLGIFPTTPEILALFATTPLARAEAPAPEREYQYPLDLGLWLDLDLDLEIEL